TVIVIHYSLRQINYPGLCCQQATTKINILAESQSSKTANLLPHFPTHQQIRRRQVLQRPLDAYLLGTHSHKQRRANILVTSKHALAFVCPDHSTNRRSVFILKGRYQLRQPVRRGYTVTINIGQQIMTCCLCAGITASRYPLLKRMAYNPYHPTLCLK